MELRSWSAMAKGCASTTTCQRDLARQGAVCCRPAGDRAVPARCRGGPTGVGRRAPGRHPRSDDDPQVRHAAGHPAGDEQHRDGDDYQIAVRQFKQQILPGGIWNTLNGRDDDFPATTVWSYGPNADPMPDSAGLGGAAGIAPAANSQFNYPAYTIETTANTPVKVRWINDLVDKKTGNYLPHLLPIDQTLHWANPPRLCIEGPAGRTAGASSRGPTRDPCRS